jgi:hypothetical protein
MTGCAAPGADLIVIPASDSATTFDSMDRAMLQLRVKNQGVQPAQHSPVTVEFHLSKCTVTSPFQDGGTLAAGQSSSVLKFEVPQDCMDSGCEFQIKIDPQKKSNDSDRTNNSIQGRFVRDTAKK